MGEYGMYSYSYGGATYNGLLIDHNTITIAHATTGDHIVGIWENGWAFSSNITISNNSFINLVSGPNHEQAFWITSHSSASTTVTYSDNSIDGANIGFKWLGPSEYPNATYPVPPDFSGNKAIQLSSNTVTNTDTGVLVQSNGIARLTNNTITNNNTGVDIVVSPDINPIGPIVTVNCNRILDNTTGIRSDTSATIASSGTTTGNWIEGNTTGVDGSAILSGAMTAGGDWWGCLAGPGNAGCDTVTSHVNVTSVSPSVPGCLSSCTADVDCNDGKACVGPTNPSETCNTETNMCQVPVPAVCGLNGANPQCNDAVCVEPTGCEVEMHPDNTPCNTGDTCQAGVCTGSNTLSVATVRLVRNSAKSAGRSNGVVYVNAVVNDADTGGTLVTDLTNGLVTLDVQDGGAFSVTITPTSCLLNARTGKVSCKKDPTSKTLATFTKIRRVPAGTAYGQLYKMVVRRTGLGTSDTGSAQPSGPVTVILHQTLVDRPEVVNTCAPSGNNALVCRD
jgi:hypothetical protein